MVLNLEEAICNFFKSPEDSPRKLEPLMPRGESKAGHTADAIRQISAAAVKAKRKCET